MPFDAELVRARLPGRQVVWLESTDSTMTEAARLAAEGWPPGAVVAADEQTEGQGRYGRSWHSPKGSGLYMSMILGTDAPPEALQSLTLALGLAAREAILLATGLACELKWPNDLLLDGKKCAGILVQRTASGVIAGIGINVNQAGFPPELERTATSLRMVSGVEHPREELLVSLVAAVDRRRVGDRDAAGVGRGQQ